MSRWDSSAGAEHWIPFLNAAEVKYGIPHNLLARQCAKESSFNPAARNPSGAIGLMQLLPQYFPGAGLDPVKDISTAAVYLASLYRRFKDWQLALAAYDWGPGDLSKWQKSQGTFATLPKETRDYVTEIIADVPVEGILCKTPSLPLAGSPVVPSSSVPASAPSSGSSLWHSVTGFLTRRSVPNSPAPPPLSVSDSAPISSPIENPKGNSMSTSTGQAILAVLESDLLTSAGEPLLAFLTSTKANPSPLNVAAQWIALQGALIGALPGLESTIATQIIAALQAKLQTAITAAEAAAPKP